MRDDTRPPATAPQFAELPPPDLGMRWIPQPRRPAPYRTDEYEAGYDAGHWDGSHNTCTEERCFGMCARCKGRGA